MIINHQQENDIKMKGMRCVAGCGGRWHSLRELHVSQSYCVISMCLSTTPHAMKDDELMMTFNL